MPSDSQTPPQSGDISGVDAAAAAAPQYQAALMTMTVDGVVRVWVNVDLSHLMPAGVLS